MNTFDLFWNIPCDKACVYAIVCNKTWRSYVGSTGAGLRKRIKAHLESLNAKKHTCHDLQKDFEQYGKDGFKVEILEEINNDLELFDKEDYWKNFGCNLYNEGPSYSKMPNFDKEFVDRFWGKIDKKGENECWNWKEKTISPEGYGRVKYKQKMYTASRVACYLTNGKLSNNQACHTCDNVKCCNPNHIIFKSSQFNIRDRIKKERFTKLNWEIVNYIRTEYIKNHYVSGNWLKLQIQKNFNIDISITTIAKIIANKYWVDDKFQGFNKESEGVYRRFTHKNDNKGCFVKAWLE